MSAGIIINACSVVLGGIIGALARNHIPVKLKSTLPMAFSLSAMGMGVNGVVKAHSLPAIILALLLGTIIGTMCGVERGIRRCGEWLGAKLAGGLHVDEASEARALEFFSIGVILFCAGATGIYGSLQAAVTGDQTILLAKSILDFFTALIFAASAGYGIALLGLPMFVSFSVLYCAAGFIVPLTTPGMLADFTGCGGLLILAAGFRMAEIKIYHVADMLPALILVMPVSRLWDSLPF